MWLTQPRLQLYLYFFALHCHQTYSLVRPLSPITLCSTSSLSISVFSSSLFACYFSLSMCCSSCSFSSMATASTVKAALTLFAARAALFLDVFVLVDLTVAATGSWHLSLRPRPSWPGCRVPVFDSGIAVDWFALALRVSLIFSLHVHDCIVCVCCWTVADLESSRVSGQWVVHEHCGIGCFQFTLSIGSTRKVVEIHRTKFLIWFPGYYSTFFNCRTHRIQM